MIIFEINGDLASFLQEKYFNIRMINRLVNCTGSRSSKGEYAKLFISELAEECHDLLIFLRNKVSKKYWYIIFPRRITVQRN
jgi:hypothetical protein